MDLAATWLQEVSPGEPPSLLLNWAIRSFQRIAIGVLGAPSYRRSMRYHEI